MMQLFKLHALAPPALPKELFPAMVQLFSVEPYAPAASPAAFQTSRQLVAVLYLIPPPPSGPPEPQLPLTVHLFSTQEFAPPPE